MKRTIIAQVFYAATIATGIAFGMAAQDCKAGTIGIHVASVHSQSGYNNFNPGLYYKHDNGATVGTFRNSERRQSFYAAWTWEFFDERLGLTAGAVTGYSRAAVFPMLVPSLKFRVGDLGAVRLSLLAPPREAMAVHLSFERRF